MLNNLEAKNLRSRCRFGGLPSEATPPLIFILLVGACFFRLFSYSPFLVCALSVFQLPLKKDTCRIGVEPVLAISSLLSYPFKDIISNYSSIGVGI